MFPVDSKLYEILKAKIYNFSTGAEDVRVRGVHERLMSSLRACAMGGHRVYVLVVLVLVVLVVVVLVIVILVLVGGSRRVAGSHGIPWDVFS